MFLHLSVSHSVHGGVCLSACWDTHTPRQTPLPRQTPHPPWQTHPPAQCMLGYTPCPVHAGIDTATAADVTHPTGMHCYILVIAWCRKVFLPHRNYEIQKETDIDANIYTHATACTILVKDCI